MCMRPLVSLWCPIWTICLAIRHWIQVWDTYRVTTCLTWREGRTNPYDGSLLGECNHASKEPMYALFRPNPHLAWWNCIGGCYIDNKDALHGHITYWNSNNFSCKLECKERGRRVVTLLLFMCAMKSKIMVGHVISQRVHKVILTNYLVDLTIRFVYHRVITQLCHVAQDSWRPCELIHRGWNKHTRNKPIAPFVAFSVTCIIMFYA